VPSDPIHPDHAQREQARLRLAGDQSPDPRDAREMHLVEAIRAGDQTAWAELLGGYQHRIYSICLRMIGDREIAADLTQDAMVKIIQGMDRFDARSKLSTWIYRVTMNVCLTHLRARKHRTMGSLDAAGLDDSGSARSAGLRQSREPTAERSVQESGRQHDLGEALLTLSEEHRAILILRDARQLEYDIIAEVLGIAVGTVKSRLFRARTALRRALEAAGTEGASEPGQT